MYRRRISVPFADPLELGNNRYDTGKNREHTFSNLI
uniref:Uncharacterized protein n=1 Tax=Promethearchaeum syntrophicum TaxID=2594042 RepID=A0A5B9DAX5_9ARCH|nr:hypothetical protein DSAG12_02133 [Candidatus Prometheoarchaeum syntrophicum]